MLEVYNEQVNDLLSKTAQKGGLVVRQHPSQGYFYAQDLKKIPVGSYKEIEQQIEEGTNNRTVNYILEFSIKNLKLCFLN